MKLLQINFTKVVFEQISFFNSILMNKPLRHKLLCCNTGALLWRQQTVTYLAHKSSLTEPFGVSGARLIKVISSNESPSFSLHSSSSSLVCYSFLHNFIVCVFVRKKTTTTFHRKLAEEASNWFCSAPTQLLTEPFAFNWRDDVFFLCNMKRAQRPTLYLPLLV